MKTLGWLLIVFIPLCFTTASCGKKKTLNIRIKVVDINTGNPVKASIKLDYQKRPGGFQSVYEKEYGQTDANGEIHVVDKIGKTYNHVVKVYANGYSNAYSYGVAERINVSLGHKSEYTVKLRPNYHFLLSVKNVSCGGETDTVWLNSSILYSPGIYVNYTRMYTGCADTVVRFAYSDFTFWSLNPDLVFDVTVKRNGVVSSFQHPVTLVQGQTTPIHIDY